MAVFLLHPAEQPLHIRHACPLAVVPSRHEVQELLTKLLCHLLSCRRAVLLKQFECSGGRGWRDNRTCSRRDDRSGNRLLRALGDPHRSQRLLLLQK